MKASQHEELLRYYRDELTYLRRMGGEFAALYPRVASRLELGRDECADPQVERLLDCAHTSISNNGHGYPFLEVEYRSRCWTSERV